MIKFTIKTTQKSQLIDITAKIEDYINNFSGTCLIYTPHTTAAITINEGVDPNVKSDALKLLAELVPWNTDYFKHTEGNSAAHIKAMMIGNSRSVIIENGHLQLGTWESVFYCEFDGPRSRNVWLQFIDVTTENKVNK